MKLERPQILQRRSRKAPPHAEGPACVPVPAPLVGATAYPWGHGPAPLVVRGEGGTSNCAAHLDYDRLARRCVGDYVYLSRCGAR